MNERGLKLTGFAKRNCPNMKGKWFVCFCLPVDVPACLGVGFPDVDPAFVRGSA